MRDCRETQGEDRRTLDKETVIETKRKCNQPGAPITIAASFFTAVGVEKNLFC